MAKHTEFSVVNEFSKILGLTNKTDGTLFIYSGEKGKAKKPDGYYYYEGITFILDAKAEGSKFTGQLKDYMSLEKNDNYIGFKYNGSVFECYVKGKLQKNEKVPRDKEYYKSTYFKTKNNNENIVDKSAKNLAKLFRKAKINKQMNVPFIGAVFLYLKFCKEELYTKTTDTILDDLQRNINNCMKDKKHQNFKKVLTRTLDDSTLRKAKLINLIAILNEISTIYAFINISSSDYKGHDIMNNFLRVFRRWNSVDAKEKGEVFTPDHIAQLMYKVANCSLDNVILDPCCGSGTFLTNAMANMFKESKKSPRLIERIKTHNLRGIEVDDFNATLASINMMLHGDGSTNIECADCFEVLPTFENLYDRVLMNPPFSVDEKELKFVFEALFYMKDDGILSTILPKSCLKGLGSNNSNLENVELLKKISEISKIESIISLPTELFLPNAGVATCILTLRKRNRKNDGSTLLIDCSDDGYTYSNMVRQYTSKWETIIKEVLSACKGKNKDSKRVCKVEFNPEKEMLFEAFNSKRKDEISKETFEKYLREYAASRILCGVQAKMQKKQNFKPGRTRYCSIPISSILIKEKFGHEKSMNRKLENKYIAGIPIIIAKKDNNGVGGLIKHPIEVYEDKICIVKGGDGGGGKTYYVDFKFCATPFIMICDFAKSIKLDKLSKFYISVVISETLYTTVSHGRNISDVPNIKIKLPTNNKGKLNNTYMSNYIKNLQFSEFLQ